MEKTLRILFIGDVVGQAGQAIFQKTIPSLKQKLGVHAVVVNGENVANKGVGISPKHITFFRHNGADVITSGNHIWAQKDSQMALEQGAGYLIRPANFPSACPGKGYALVGVKGYLIGVINVQGRVFMQQDLDCPFKTVESLLYMLREKTKMIFVDIHAETSSEKQALAFYLDGKVSGVVGTHTHVQTADERILPQGTAYITDLGYCGALNSTLGVKKEAVIQRFLTQMPQRFSVEKSGPFVLHGAMIDVDTLTGKAVHIERIRIIDEEVHKQLVHEKDSDAEDKGD